MLVNSSIEEGSLFCYVSGVEISQTATPPLIVLLVPLESSQEVEVHGGCFITFRPMVPPLSNVKQFCH
jgi:hypothetical protein